MSDIIEIRLEGGEFALPVEIGGCMSKDWWTPTRRGEETRKCAKCGAEFKPNSRNQKHCDKCKAKRVTR